MSASFPSTLPRHLTTLAGAYALAGGLVSFIGWAAGIYRLTDWGGGGISIKTNAALAAAAAGAALLVGTLRPSAPGAVRALGGFVATVGGLTLLQHLTGANLGIDTLLFDERPGAAATVAPNRMGPPASTSYLVLGMALMLATGGARARGVSVALGLAGLAIGMLSLTGHWYGAAPMYAIPRFTGIAAQTASMILALGIGVVALSPDREPMRTLCDDSTAGILGRRVVPVVLTLPLLLGWLRVRGQETGLYDAAFGTALRSVLEIAILAALVWFSLQAIRNRDIQRRRAADDLEKSARRLTETLESITDGFVTFDRDWRFTYVNREAERYLGRSREALLGKVVWEIFPGIVGTHLYREFQRAAAQRAMVEIESPDLIGNATHFVNRVYPSADGGLSVYFQDVTLRKQHEDAQREAERRKDEFLATLAHELRNPLAPVRNAARVLMKKGVPAATLQWGAEVINRQVDHMARLLDDLLDVSRISLNRLELRKEWIDLATVVQTALETSRPVIEAAGHELRVDVPAEPLYVDGDPVRLAQVLSNLLNNAAKYTERGGHIDVSMRSTDRHVEIRVRDDGIGIAPDTLPTIFEMFAQAKPALQRSQGGLGIGLWLAKGIVELHGGRIEAASAGASRGSEFVMRLPRLTGIGEASPRADEEPAVVPRRILVVDDVTDTADSLAILLRTLGHEVRAAYGGEEAIALARSFRPEAVLLDIGMPGLNGLDVCRQLRASECGEKSCIIALTGWGQAEDRRRTKEAGFDHHLVKPVDLSALVMLLTALPPDKAA